MSRTHLQAWSALMAVVGVLVMLGASVASAEPSPKETDPSASAGVTLTVTVTPTILVRKAPNGQEVTLDRVTVTPTILVRKNANGELVTVGTVMPSANPAANPGASSGGVLAWIVVGLALLLVAGGAYWWLVRRSTHETPLAGRHARVTPPSSDAPPEGRPEH